MTQIEFFFDYGSPYSFLANGVIPTIAEKLGAQLEYRPMLLGAVFKATGNQSPMMETIEAKRNYAGGALRRTSELHGVPISGNPHFPINTLGIMRLAVAAQREGVFDTYHAAVYPSFWQEGLDLGDPQVQGEVLSGAGLDAEKLLARAADDDVKAELRANTDEAISRGAFGAPTFFVDDRMWWGNDRIDLMTWELAADASA